MYKGRYVASVTIDVEIPEDGNLLPFEVCKENHAQIGNIIKALLVDNLGGLDIIKNIDVIENFRDFYEVADK